MPRVTPEHSAARRQQILDAAHACFLRDGFHQTSMQDIQREAGLSAGAIYLYFKGKDEIILGIAERILATVATLFPDEPVLDGVPSSLPELVKAFLAKAEEQERAHHIFPIALQVWAEAVRNPSIREPLIANLVQVRRQVGALLAACQARGIVPADADPEALTMALIGIGQGYIVQRTMIGPAIVDTYVSGVLGLLGAPSGGVGRLEGDLAGTASEAS